MMKNDRLATLMKEHSVERIEVTTRWTQVDVLDFYDKTDKPLMFRLDRDAKIQLRKEVEKVAEAMNLTENEIALGDLTIDGEDISFTGRALTWTDLVGVK